MQPGVHGEVHHRHERGDDEDEHRDADFAGDEACLLYTSDAADERSSVDLGGRRIIKKKKTSDLDRRIISLSKTSHTS